jgi:hypothetical protein
VGERLGVDVELRRASDQSRSARLVPEEAELVREPADATPPSATSVVGSEVGRLRAGVECGLEGRWPSSVEYRCLDAAQALRGLEVADGEVVVPAPLSQRDAEARRLL